MNDLHDLPQTVTDNTVTLFPNDTGGLTLGVRQILCKLMEGPLIDENDDSKRWNLLVVNEDLIRSELHKFFLDLVLDREMGVAYTRQIHVPELKTPILLKRHVMSLLDSVLVVHLRGMTIKSSAEGTRAVAGRQDMVDFLSAYQKTPADDPRTINKSNATIERMIRLGLLRKIKGSDDRFEVSPTLKLMLDADQIEKLNKAYEELRDAPRNGDDEENDNDGFDTIQGQLI